MEFQLFNNDNNNSNSNSRRNNSNKAGSYLLCSSTSETLMDL